MTQVCIEMETGDIDDILTLVILLQNKSIKIKAVVVTPGSLLQIGLVKSIIKTYGYNVPIGGFDHTSNAKLGSQYAKLFNFTPITQNEWINGVTLLRDYSGKNVTLFTIGPPKAYGKLMIEYPNTQFKELVSQGGFAGTGVVPENKILEKFRGMTMCATCNFNGGKEYTIALLNSNIPKKFCISKNICHGYIYDENIDKVINKSAKDIMHRLYGDNIFTKQKAMHDILACVAILNKECFTFAEVQIMRNKGKFGAHLQSGTNIFISIDFNKEMANTLIY